jgi:hypothetical protein
MDAFLLARRCAIRPMRMETLDHFPESITQQQFIELRLRE